MMLKPVCSVSKFDLSGVIVEGIDFLRLLSCGLCSIDVSVVKTVSPSVSSEIKSIMRAGYLSLDRVHYGQPSRVFGSCIKRSTGA